MDHKAYEDDAKLLALYPQGVRGIYRAVDYSALVTNQNLSADTINPGLQFRLCDESASV